MKLVAVMLLGIGCGGTSHEAHRAAQAPAALPALDALAAEVEAVGAFAGPIACEDYTESVALHVRALDRLTAAAARESGTASPIDLTAWQTAHAARLDAMVAKTATPLRSVTGCSPVDEDQVWHRVSTAVVTLAKPRALPPVIAKLDSIDAATIQLLSRAVDCKSVFPSVEAMYQEVEAEYKALPPRLVFVDDMVWEETREKRLETSPYRCVNEFVSYAVDKALEASFSKD